MSERIPEAFIHALLERINIVEIIETRLSLTKRGTNYLALCPFHQEKTPSFTINPIKQFYYCFGCAASGNAIGFLMTFDRLSFRETISQLAARAGLPLPQDSKKEYHLKFQTDYALLSKVVRYYQHQLNQMPHARAYLQSRGIFEQTIKDFSLGYAPFSGNYFTNFSQEQAVQSLLIQHGLLIQKNQRTFARFRNRIMFPIQDINGRSIAFGGRVLNHQLPKYLNSPQTVLFHKSNELYGLYEAKRFGQLSSLIVVEGYFDVLILQQNNFPAVAALGTAINEMHLKKLLFHSQDLLFCLDADAAGQRAVWRTLITALPLMHEGIQMRFLELPPGEDPDSFIRKKGVEAFKQYLKKANSFSETFFAQLSKTYPIKTTDDKASFAKEALSYLQKLPRGLFRELMQTELSTRLSISQASFETLEPTPTRSPTKAQARVFPPAFAACAILLQHPTLIQSLPDLNWLTEIETSGNQLLHALIQFLKTNPTITTGQLLAVWPNPNEYALIAKLTARPLPSEDCGQLLEELNGALKRLREHQTERLVEELIQKSKTQGLSEIERKKLANLLTTSVNTSI